MSDVQRGGPTTWVTGVCEIKEAGLYKFKGIRGSDVTNPQQIIGFGDIDAPKPCEFTGPRGFYFANTGVSG